MRILPLLLVVSTLLLPAAGCGAGEEAGSATASGAEPTGSVPLPQGSEPANLDPADFVAEIDNQWWPMPPGTRWVYRETGDEGAHQRVEVTVADETREVAGIEATVVHDVVSEDGKVIEDTYDWYAQDEAGNIWYLGEDTTEYDENRKPSTEGSWEAGVDGAEAGVIMPANPEVGMAFRQEYYEGEAEDAGEILSLDEQVEVPFGSFDNVLMTKDFTPLEPDVLEHKFYAKGIGPVLATSVSGGSGREELVSFEQP